jgi:hypothetical protein
MVARMAKRCHEADPSPSLLAPLAVGDELPWRLDRNGNPQWLAVVARISADSYLVHYPDGATAVLVDSM